MREFFAQLHAFHFSDQDLRTCRNRYARKLRDSRRLLSDNLRVQRAVDENGLSDLFAFAFTQDMTAPLYEFRLYLFVNGFENDYALLGGADHAVIEGLGMNDRIYGDVHVRGVVDDGGVFPAPTPRAGFPLE